MHVHIIGIILVYISVAAAASFEPLLIFPLDKNVPDYSTLETLPPAPVKSFQVVPKPLLTKSAIELLPLEILHQIIGYLDCKALGRFLTTSATLYISVEEVLSVMGSVYVLKGLSRKDQIILLFCLIPQIFKSSYPAILNRNITSIDRIFLILVSVLVSSKLVLSDYSENIEPSALQYLNLQSSLIKMDFFKLNFKYPGPSISDLLNYPCFLMYFLSKCIDFPIHYTLEALATLRNNQKSVKIENDALKIESILLHRLGFSMAKSDHRFLHNYLKGLSNEELMSTTIDGYHILHKFILIGGIYLPDLFSRPLGALFDDKINLNFYSSAIIYAIKSSNISTLKGLLTDYPNETFTGLSHLKLNKLRSISGTGDLNDYLDPFLKYSTSKIAQYFRNDK